MTLSLLYNLVKMTDGSNKVPFFGEFNDQFAPLATPFVAVNGLTGQTSMTVGNVNRKLQLPFNQLLAGNKVGPVNFGMYQSISLLKSQNPNPLAEMTENMNKMRATIGLSKDTEFGTLGGGIILPGSWMANRVIDPNTMGFHLFARTNDTTVEVQAINDGELVNLTKNLYDDIYVGASYSNLMDVTGKYASVFVSRIPSSIDTDLSFWENVKHNSKLLLGFNGSHVHIGNDPEYRNTVIGQCSVPTETMFGNAMVLIGASANLNEHTNSTISVSAKQEISDSGFSVMTSIDTTPLNKRWNAAMFGLEYNRSNFGLGLYLEATNGKHIEFAPKIGLNLKF